MGCGSLVLAAATAMAFFVGNDILGSKFGRGSKMIDEIAYTASLLKR